ncbi:MAG: hypothetical protein LBL66_04155 [Clostridiales bacterium]|jgi:hypothetical protein|nr:hypothetical protein [Clostridiales bacterium]
MKKKFFALAIAALMCVNLLAACGTRVGGDGLAVTDGGGSVHAPETPAVETPELPALNRPSALYYDAGAKILSWETVEGAASGYSVLVKRGAADVVDETAERAETALGGLEAGDYSAAVKAKAVANYYRESETAVYAFTVGGGATGVQPTQKTPQPETFAYDADADRFFWSDAAGGNGYVLEVFDAENVRRLRYDGIENSASAATLAIGAYTAALTVSGDGVEYADSDEKTVSFAIASFGALPAPQNLSVADGNLTWDAVPHTSGAEIRAVDLAGGAAVAVQPKFSAPNQLILADMGVDAGSYRIYAALTSNRHDAAKSAESDAPVKLERAASFNASQIASFNGNSPRGEHGAAGLTTVNGVTCAEIRPTADGWGRVASADFSLDFSKNPVAYMAVESVGVGGYHMQAVEGDQTYLVVPDTQKTGGAVVDLARKTGLSGFKTVYVRIGVNNSTSTDANDARVYYREIKILYISLVTPPAPSQLGPVTGPAVDNRGSVTWTPPANAEWNAFGVTVADKDDPEDIVFEGETGAAGFPAYTLPAGIYRAAVTAKNTAWAQVGESEPVEFLFKVTDIVRYPAAQIDTAAGAFETAKDIQAAYHGESGRAVLNSAGISDTYGWIRPKTGVSVNMDKNPLAVVHTSAASGGYFIKCSFDGSGAAEDVCGDVKNNNYSEPRDLLFRLNANSAAQDGGGVTWTGIKTDYKFMPGVTALADSGNGMTSTVTVAGIDLLYVEEYEEIDAPPEPVKLDAPADFEIAGALLAARPVAGNAAYTPVYDVNVTHDGGGGEAVYSGTDLPSPQVNLSALALAVGETYTVSIAAKGDGVYFADSDPGTRQFIYASKVSVTDFSAVSVAQRQGNITVASKGADGLLLWVDGTAWGIAAVALPVADGALSDNCALIVEFGAVTAGANRAYRYYVGASGTAFTSDLGGDQPVSANTAYVYSLAGAATTGGNFYLGLGFGGGSATRTMLVKSVQIVEYALVSD